MIIVGLGNPGEEYRRTRHNAGFLLLEAACRRWRCGEWSRQRLFRENQLRVAGGGHRLVQPLTYMNCSGEAVDVLLREGAAPEDLVIVLDDVELPLGRLRIRHRGGAGGHNGLQSILDVVANQRVARMRLGVGRPEGSGRMTEHVLGPFEDEDWERFTQILARALDALHVILKQGITAAMNRFNGLPAPWDEADAAADAAVDAAADADANAAADADAVVEGE